MCAELELWCKSRQRQAHASQDNRRAEVNHGATTPNIIGNKIIEFNMESKHDDCDCVQVACCTLQWPLECYHTAESKTTSTDLSRANTDPVRPYAEVEFTYTTRAQNRVTLQKKKTLTLLVFHVAGYDKGKPFWRKEIHQTDIPKVWLQIRHREREYIFLWFWAISAKKKRWLHPRTYTENAPGLLSGLTAITQRNVR